MQLCVLHVVVLAVDTKCISACQMYAICSRQHWPEHQREALQDQQLGWGLGWGLG